ncbi:glycoside hydrolase family 13 protein [Pseudocitrobacter faecalis]|uniref:glycoside hydrolase family 13 protein n=1 Tax=Pseudocitrobacter faecalis TaxID=1398493 RepID=UPI0039F04936
MTAKNDWWRNAVIYQIYPKSFMDSNGDGVGDLPGIISRLDYIQALGVDAIWLSPIFLSPGKDNGYDIQDYCCIDPQFGSNDDIDELILQAHQRGLKVIMDLVANHTSDQHDWFLKSKTSRDNPYSDYYIWRDPLPDGGVPNNWGANFGGSAWEWCPERQQYYLHLFAKEQPDLNWENPRVRDEIYRIMEFWAQKGIDGWRMDVITLISKYTDFPNYQVDHNLPVVGWMHSNGPRVHEFIQEMHDKVLAPYGMMTVGEAQGSTPENALQYIADSRRELDMVFTFEHTDVDILPGGINRKWQLQPFSLPRLKSILAKWQDGLHGLGWNALYFENHDQPRIVSRWGNDQAYRAECATAWATVLHGMQGTPFVYQGEEIGMTNIHLPLEQYNDVEIVNNYNELVVKQKTQSHDAFMAAVYQIGRDNARTPMQWDSSPYAGFSSATPWLPVNPRYKEINVMQDRQNNLSVFRYYQQLIALRHRERILIEGDFELLLPEHPQLFCYMRRLEDKCWLVVANLSDGEVSFEWQDLKQLEAGRVIISNMAGTDENRILKPWMAFIMEY